MLFWLATGCAPLHVALPSAPDGGEVLSVSGRGDLSPDYRIGEYRVLPLPLGFATSERSDYLISTALARVESFVLRITSPDGAEEEINCALKARIQRGFEEGRRYEGAEVECIGGDVVLFWERAVDKTLVGTVLTGDKTLVFAPAAEASAPGLPRSAAAVLRRGDVAVVAVDRLSAGRVILVPGAGRQTTRAAVILLAVVNTTESMLARWARGEARAEGPRELGWRRLRAPRGQPAGTPAPRQLSTPAC